MKSLGFGRVTLSSCVVAVMLAGCGVLRQAQDDMQPPVGSPEAMSQTSTITPCTVRRAVFGVAAPDSARRGIYASEEQSSESDVFGYPSNNRNNRGPICSENSQPTYDLAVDDGGNLIVPNPSDTVTVFKGPGMCGRELGTLQTMYLPVDATSSNAASGTIAVGIVLDGQSGDGSIQLCTLKRGCYANLTDGTQMDFVAAVAMSKKGDCWASSAVPTALTYFKGCSATAQSATGYENSDAGGLDIDNNGNLVSISCSEVSCSTPLLYVYSGCDPKCKKVGGPFPLQGASWYGHLNASGTRFAAADYEYGQIDIYEYTPTSVRYMYSFNNGLSAGERMGAAYNPRSKE
ncbi:MAG: hypothetical protein ABSF08_10665 [Candidatus Cybelea sp.]